MINLLPKKEKEELILRQKNKIAIVLGFCFLVFLVCLLMVMFSVKIFLSGEDIVQTENLNEMKNSYKASDFSLIEKNIKDYNKTLDGLDIFYNNQVYLSSMLKSLSAVSLPKGVILLDLSADRKPDNSLWVNVYGFSDTRDNLIKYKNQLENQKDLKNLNFSPESWTRSEKVNFYLNFQYDAK